MNCLNGFIVINNQRVIYKKLESGKVRGSVLYSFGFLVKTNRQIQGSNRIAEYNYANLSP